MGATGLYAGRIRGVVRGADFGCWARGNGMTFTYRRRRAGMVSRKNLFPRRPAIHRPAIKTLTSNVIKMPIGAAAGPTVRDRFPLFLRTYIMSNTKVSSNAKW